MMHQMMAVPGLKEEMTTYACCEVVLGTTDQVIVGPVVAIRAIRILVTLVLVSALFEIVDLGVASPFTGVLKLA